jgi:cytochrome P450
MDIRQFFNLKDPLHVSGLASVVTILFLFATWTHLSNKRNLSHIPTIGPAGILTSYIGALRFVVGANEMIREGYRKYKGSAFKVACLHQWLVIVTGPQAVEELRQAAEDELSFLESMEDTLAISYTMGSNFQSNLYHVPIIRNQLTKNIGTVFPEVQDEIMQVFDDEIHPTADWTKVSAVQTLMQIVCRTSNRVFVGLPLCRDPDWVALTSEFMIDVVKAGTIITLFPKFLRPIIGRLLQSTFLEAKLRRSMRRILPLLEERKRHIAECGTAWDGKPNDMLSWLIDEASEVERSSRNLTLRIMSINLAAIHTSTMSFAHALYDLAVMPQYLQPLHDEVEAVVSEEGWTKSAMSKLYKVDSFLKESLRFNHLAGSAQIFFSFLCLA